jgi:uncharacterized membrane protein
MKACPRCSTVCDDNYTLCPKCGYIFSQNEYYKNNSYGARPNNYYAPYSDGKTPVLNSMAVVSLVLGIVGVVLICCRPVCVIISALAIIFGCISNNSIKKSQGRQTGFNFSTAGIVLGICGFSLCIILSILMSLSILNFFSFFNPDLI